MTFKDDQSRRESRVGGLLACFSLSQRGGSGHPYCMRTTAVAALACALSLGSLAGCSSEGIGNAADSGAAGSSSNGTSLALAVGPDSRTFVELSQPSEVKLD